MTLHVQDLALNFDKKTIFSGVNFSLQRGQIGALLGHSGSGKTSILRCILGFLTPSAGQILIGDKILFTPRKNLAPHLRNIGIVFQDFALFPHLNVFENVAFGLKNFTKSQKISRVNELLSVVGLTDLAKRYPHELSGGQQQRIALARSIAPRPDFILLDEPFSNLDENLRKSLSADVKQILKTQEIGALLVTHDSAEAFAMADVMGVIDGGALLQWDAPENLFHTPICEAVARFVCEGLFLDAEFLGQSARTIFGEIFCENAPPDPKRAKVLARFSDIFLEPMRNSNAKILSKTFAGEFFLYEILIDGQKFIIKSRQNVSGEIRVKIQKCRAL